MNIHRQILRTWLVAIMAFFVLFIGCKKEETQININQEAPEIITENSKQIIWHVKAFHPEGRLLDVKAIDKEGNIHDVKSIQDSEQTSIMDVKAFVDGKKLPVKMLVSDNEYLPVKAITDDGTIIDIKALTPEGDKLDVKGVLQSGNIIHIRAITEDGKTYNIEAISPKGWINDVKGIKMLKTPVELTLNGVDVYAHIKAIPQTNQL